MKKVRRANYALAFQVRLDDIKLEDGQTYDEWVEKNFFHLIADKLEELGVEGGVGFMNHAHHYLTLENEEQ